MKMYLVAVTLALGETAALVQACMLNEPSGRAVQLSVVHNK
jgi:hypothetical protein